MESQTTDYGRFEMKRTYLKNLRKGLEFAIILHVVLVGTYMLVSYINKLSAEVIPPYNVHGPINLVDIGQPPSINDENKPPEKPIEEITKPLKNLEAMTPEPVAKKDAEIMTINTQNQLDKINGNVSKEGDSVQYVYNGNGNDIKIDKQNETKIDKNITKNENSDKNYNGSEVDVAPECTNFAQVMNSVVYPTVAVEANIEGKVTIRVLVDKNGKVIKTSNITGPEIFYNEVTEKAKNLEFTPGLMSNKAVNVWVTVPFSFVLK